MANVEAGRYSPDIKQGGSKPLTLGVYDTKEGVHTPMPDVPSWQRHQQEVQRPAEGGGTERWITYFDTQWQKEGLPQNWFDLKSQQSNRRVGFIMSRQMHKLRDVTDQSSVYGWAQETRRDLEGFKLEFLSDNVVYPRKYIRNALDETRLEDPLYGKAKGRDDAYADIEEIVSDQERNGSVRRSIGEAKRFLLSDNTPDGSIVMVTSPLGSTGFKTDDGLAIDYPDSYFFLLQKKGDEVMNYTLKTSFTLQDCREAISRVAGKEVPQGSSLESYVDAIAKIKQRDGERALSVADVVATLASIRPDGAFIDQQSSKKTSWQEVYHQVAQGEELYNFDKETAAIIAEFEAYVQEGGHTKAELQKGIAATILRMGNIFFQEQKSDTNEIVLKANVWSAPVRKVQPSFGAILEQTAERRGCSGGGSSVMVGGSLISRRGEGGGDQYGKLDFDCPDCHKKNIRTAGKLLPACKHCGSKAVSCEQPEQSEEMKTKKELALAA